VVESGWTLGNRVCDVVLIHVECSNEEMDSKFEINTKKISGTESDFVKIGHRKA
jgi:hypothetical protein